MSVKPNLNAESVAGFTPDATSRLPLGMDENDVPQWLTKALARYDATEADLVSITLSRGQMGALLGVAARCVNDLEEQGHTTDTSGYLKLMLGVQYLLDEALRIGGDAGG